MTTEEMLEQATPRPWTATSSKCGFANEALIVRAVNNFERMRDALQMVVFADQMTDTAMDAWTLAHDIASNALDAVDGRR